MISLPSLPFFPFPQPSSLFLLFPIAPLPSLSPLLFPLAPPPPPLFVLPLLPFFYQSALSLLFVAPPCVLHFRSSPFFSFLGRFVFQCPAPSPASLSLAPPRPALPLRSSPLPLVSFRYFTSSLPLFYTSLRLFPLSLPFTSLLPRSSVSTSAPPLTCTLSPLLLPARALTPLHLHTGPSRSFCCPGMSPC